MSYINKQDVADATGLDVEDIPDSAIKSAQIEVNKHINCKIDNEPVTEINSHTKTNEVNGSNTIFYTRYFPLADRNDDFYVNSDDVDVYSLNSDTKKEYVVEEVVVDNGKIVLTEAPERDEYLYVNYSYANVNPNESYEVRQAAVNYAAHLVYIKNFGGLPSQASVGPVNVSPRPDDQSGYLRVFRNIIRSINSGDYIEVSGDESR